MNKLFENWRRYLEEEQLEEKLVLKKGKTGWWKYSQLVAEAYLAAPDMSGDQNLIALYEELGRWLEKAVGRIETRTQVTSVDYHPYDSAKVLRQKVDDEGEMKVSTADAEHPIWKGEQGLKWNTAFRTWHDYQSHYARKTAFSLQGEFKSYNNHANMLPNRFVPALFTEVVGQISCFYQNGKNNCPQKAVILDDFDFFNVGLLSEKGRQRIWADGNRYRADTDKNSPTFKLLIPIQDKTDVEIEDED